MVRLVFRPYTRVGRSICTSESLRTSTRVSSGLVLHGHSSPSFGCQRVRSSSAPRTLFLGDGPLLRSESAAAELEIATQPRRRPSRFIAPLGFGGPIDSRTCWTPWSVFQDGSGGLPTYSPQTTASSASKPATWYESHANADAREHEAAKTRRPFTLAQRQVTRYLERTAAGASNVADARGKVASAG